MRDPRMDVLIERQLLLQDMRREYMRQIEDIDKGIRLARENQEYARMIHLNTRRAALTETFARDVKALLEGETQ